MNAGLIAVAAENTLDGTAPFPQVVAKLLEAGAEYYHVDYVAMRMTYYGEC